MDDDLIEVFFQEYDDFLKIAETLTRIGIQGRNNTLYQTCHILHKKGRYYLVHFKEMFKLDGKPTDITEEDIARRNIIIGMLIDWGLIECDVELPKTETLIKLKIVKFKDKNHWTLESKYTIGS